MHYTLDDNKLIKNLGKFKLILNFSISVDILDFALILVCQNDLNFGFKILDFRFLKNQF
jgi:hypothetical protein